MKNKKNKTNAKNGSKPYGECSKLSGDYCGCWYEVLEGTQWVWRLDRKMKRTKCITTNGTIGWKDKEYSDTQQPNQPKQVGAGNCGCGSKSYHLQHEDYLNQMYKRVLLADLGKPGKGQTSEKTSVDARTHPVPAGTLNHCCICDKRSHQYACQALDPIMNRGDIARRQKECRITGEKYRLPSHHVMGSDCGPNGRGNCKHTCWPDPTKNL